MISLIHIRTGFHAHQAARRAIARFIHRGLSEVRFAPERVFQTALRKRHRMMARIGAVQKYTRFHRKSRIA